MKISLFFLGLFCLFAFIKRHDLLDTSQELFFPAPTMQKIQDFSRFQIASWNNIIIKDEKKALELCHELRLNHKDIISKIMCEPQLSEFTPLVESYLKDQFAIFGAPTGEELQEASAMELAKIAVLMGPESQKILELIRLDPLNRKDALMNKVQNIMNESFEWSNGILVQKADGRAIIPIQFNFKPEEIQKTKAFEKILKRFDAVMLGPYEGHASNRAAIEDDLDEVGIIGVLSLVLFLGFVSFLRLFKLLKLVIPTALGISFSFVITWLIYGKVHGITLSFGTGIIGLAIDYGFHYVFSRDKASAWKSNLYALLTTLVVFVIFLFTSVPLIKQMMVFSIIGLIASYVFSRWILAHDHIQVNMNISLKKSKWHALTVLLALLGIFHMLAFKVDTSIARFNYITPKVKEAQEWFYSKVSKGKIFFKVYEEKNWPMMEKDFSLVTDGSIRTESVYSYVPVMSVQEQNLKSWLDLRNEGVNLDAVKEKVFSPFLNAWKQLTPSRVVDFHHAPEYLSHLIKDQMAITMWFANGPEQEKRIKEKVQDVDSLMDIVTGFTEELSREVSLFMPITLLAIWGILFFRYRTLKQSFLCLLPFFFSLGLYGIFYRYAHFPLSFMSLLGLFLIYGLSVDYGIFSTDFFTGASRDIEEESSLNLSLFVNWISAVIGFLPLLWCEHPILNDLGLVLVIGMLGIFYSTFFVIPAMFEWGKKK